MELVNIPTDLVNQAMQYYGVSNYPPADDSCRWKLIFNAKATSNSCMVTNGENASIYMLTSSPDYDGIKCKQNHFDNPLLQIIFMNADENFIFGQTGKYIYKLVPNELYKIDNTQVEPLSARIILGEDKEEQFTKRVEWYKKEMNKLAGSDNLSYIGIIQRYANTGSEGTYQFQTGKKRYILGDTLSEWISIEDSITDLYPNFISVVSQLDFIKHNGIAVLNPLGQVVNENFNRQVEADALSNNQHTIMTRYNKRYIIHAEVYDGREYFLLSCISNKPFSVNLKEVLEVSNITSIQQPYNITQAQAGNFDVSLQYNADTGLMTSWLPTCFYDSILRTERDFMYIGTYANATKENNVIRSIPYTANIENIVYQQTKITAFKNLLQAGNNADWGLVTMDSLLASVIIPARILYNGLSIDKMPNYITNVNNEFSNGLGGIGVGAASNQTKNNFINSSSFILGQAHMQGINFITDNTSATTNIRLFMYNNAFFNAAYNWQTSSRMFLRNDPSKLPDTELTLSADTVTLEINNTSQIDIITNASSFSATVQNSNIATITQNSNNIVITAVAEGDTIIEITAHAINSQQVVKNINVTVTTQN